MPSMGTSTTFSGWLSYCTCQEKVVSTLLANALSFPPLPAQPVPLKQVDTCSKMTVKAIEM